MSLISVRPYVRVSTEEQAQEGFSIPAQRERIADFCRSQGWVVADWYIEEGKSAKDMDRPELNRLRTDLRPGEIAVVYRLDRLTRSVLDLYTLLKEWDVARVGFRSVTEVYDTTTAMGRLFLTLVAALAQWERENLGERVKVGMVELVRQGRWHGGLLPYGYDNDSEAGHLVVNPAEAAIVREIYRRYAQGEGQRAIAVELNRRGLRTKVGAEWHPNTVQYILSTQRQTYLGHTVYNKKGRGDLVVTEDTHQPILTAAEAARAEEVLKRREGMHPRVAGSKFALTGILRCGLCGGRVSGKTQPQYDKNRVRRWESRDYWCQRRVHRKQCTLPSMGADRLEEIVVNRLAALDAATLRQLAASNPPADDHHEEQEQLEAELRSITRKKKRWYDAYEAESISAQDLRERTGTLQAREEFIHARLAQIATRDEGLDIETVAQQLHDLPEFWEDAALEQKKAMLAHYLEAIVVYPEYEVELQMKPLRH